MNGKYQTCPIVSSRYSPRLNLFPRIEAIGLSDLLENRRAIVSCVQWHSLWHNYQNNRPALLELPRYFIKVSAGVRWTNPDVSSRLQLTAGHIYCALLVVHTVLLYCPTASLHGRLTDFRPVELFVNWRPRSSCPSVISYIRLLRAILVDWIVECRNSPNTLATQTPRAWCDFFVKATPRIWRGLN